MTVRYFEIAADRETVVTPLESIAPDSGFGSKYQLIGTQLREDDGNLFIYQFDQVPPGIEDLLQEDDQTLRYNIRRTEENGTFLSLYIKLEQENIISDVMRLPSVFLDLPIECEPDGNTQLEIFGPCSELKSACGAINSKYQISIIEAGDYSIESGFLTNQVTDRQKEILHAALRAGYYSVPRKTTLVELSDQLGNAPPTIQGIIRRSERSIFRRLGAAINQDSVTDDNAKNHS